MNAVRRGVAGLVVTGALVLAAAAVRVPMPGSAAGPSTTGSPHASDTSLPATAPTPEARCPGPGAPPVDRAPIAVPPFRQLVLTTADSVNLASVRVGGGVHGVVLIHDARGDLCTWWQFAQRLADDGFHVLVFDLRCYGFSECGRSTDYPADTTAAVDALRHAGATRVALVGTSLGAAVALVAAARHDTGVTGVVALSLTSSDVLTGGPDGPGPRTVTDPAPLTVTDAARRLRVPLLFCLADADGEAMPAASLATLDAPAPTVERRVLTAPGPAHGAELVADGPHSLSRQVMTFLHAHT